MKVRGVSQYKLIQEYHVSSGQLDRLRKNEVVSTYTLNRLCQILHCGLDDIAEYQDEDAEKLSEEKLGERYVGGI